MRHIALRGDLYNEREVNKILIIEIAWGIVLGVLLLMVLPYLLILAVAIVLGIGILVLVAAHDHLTIWTCFFGNQPRRGVGTQDVLMLLAKLKRDRTVAS